VYFYNFEESQKLEREMSQLQNKRTEISQVLEKYEKNKTLIEKAALEEDVHFAKFCDNLAAQLPAEINLHELNLNPLKEQDRKDSIVTTENGVVAIKGYCKKSLILNEWIALLKKQSGVMEVSLEKYSYVEEMQKPNFEITIHTK